MTTYGDDPMWSNLCTLADACSKLYGEEQPSTSLNKRVTRRRPLLQYWPRYMNFFSDYKLAADLKKAILLAPNSFTWKRKETPYSLLQMMDNLNGGGAYDPMLIFERTLTKTDVDPGQSRLSMPFNLLERNDFLTPEELRIIEDDINSGNKLGVGAVLVDHMFEKYGVILKRWEMKGTWNYCLTCGWNDVVEANGFKENDYISVWSFRWHGVLSFALVPALSPAFEQSSSSSSTITL